MVLGGIRHHLYVIMFISMSLGVIFMTLCVIICYYVLLDFVRYY